MARGGNNSGLSQMLHITGLPLAFIDPLYARQLNKKDNDVGTSPTLC
jgi:hypothetical protein